MAAPVGNTCSSIDNIKAQLNKAQDVLEFIIRNFEGRTLAEIQDKINDAIYDIDCANSDLEIIRDANSQLRSWGEDLEIEVRDLKSQL